MRVFVREMREIEKVCVCVCVCVSERERERKIKSVCESERNNVYLCVCV